MKILYSPQLSMRSYSDGRWLLSSDAQLTKMRAYVAALPQDWEWWWLRPADEVSDGLPTNVHQFPIRWPDNVLQHRFHFDVIHSRELLRLLKPDIILCEVPEHIRAWRVVQNYEGHHCPIIAMYEHVDFYAETKVLTSFMLRQIEGYLEADLCAFPLEGMRKEWHRQAHAVCKLRLKSSKSKPWQAIYSPNEVLEAGHEAQTFIRDKPTIFYISRLSDNKRTHFKEFMVACGIMKDMNVDFRVWFANPNEGLAWDEVKLCPGYEPHSFGERTLTRAEYLELLWQADIVPVLYPVDKIYSLGYCEAIIADNVMVTTSPNTTGITTKVDPKSLSETLRLAIKAMELGPDGHRRHLVKQKAWLHDDRSVEQKIWQVQKDIEELVNG